MEAYKSGYAPRIEDHSVPLAETTKRTQTRAGTERPQKRSRIQHRGYVVVAVIAIIIVVLLAWFGTGRGQEAASIEASSITSSTLTTVAPLVEAEQDGAALDGAPASGETQATSDATADSSPNTSAPADGESAGSATGDGALEMVVNVIDESCWLVVREDSEAGAEIFAGTLSAGGKQTFDSAKQYWMRVGNPQVLSVSAAGEAHTLDAPAGAFVVSGAGIKRVQ